MRKRDSDEHEVPEGRVKAPRLGIRRVAFFKEAFPFVPGSVPGTREQTACSFYTR
jgi:hypothetical protein